MRNYSFLWLIRGCVINNRVAWLGGWLARFILMENVHHINCPWGDANPSYLSQTTFSLSLIRFYFLRLQRGGGHRGVHQQPQLEHVAEAVGRAGQLRPLQVSGSAIWTVQQAGIFPGEQLPDLFVPADLGPVWPSPGLLYILRTRLNMCLDRNCFSHEKYLSQLRQDSLRQWNFWRDLERKVFASLGFKPLTWSTLILADLSKAAWPVALACP